MNPSPAMSIPGRAAPANSFGTESPTVRLRVDQASYAYSASRAAPFFTLEPASFGARECELFAIIGPNASGKSTLLKLISGAFPPLSGRVQLDGVDVSRLDARTRARRIAVVQQESPLLFPMRALEYVLQGRHPYGRGLRLATPDDQKLAEEALAQVDAEQLHSRWMDQLSGGEKQRVVLARALAQQPSLLLLDEPTLHLDIGAQVDLLRRLRWLARAERYTVILVTHDLNLTAEFADQALLLHRGKCLRVGTPGEVLQQDLLRQVFSAPLNVELSAIGKPRINVDAAGK